MPSRTYIQMLWRMYNDGKLISCIENINDLNRYVAVLEKHPEAIEEIVRRRVNMVKFANTMAPEIEISYWNYRIFEQCILDNMFMAELIEPLMFDNFDITPNFTPNLNRIAMDFQPVMKNAIVVLDVGVGSNFDTPIKISKGGKDAENRLN